MATVTHYILNINLYVLILVFREVDTKSNIETHVTIGITGINGKHGITYCTCAVDTHDS